MLEILMDPLGALVITFFAMGIISILALVLICLLKNEERSSVFSFRLGRNHRILWHTELLSTPGYMTGEILITAALGALGIAGLLTQLISKKENKFQIARVLVTVSVVAGMIDCFMI